MLDLPRTTSLLLTAALFAWTGCGSPGAHATAPSPKAPPNASSTTPDTAPNPSAPPAASNAAPPDPATWEACGAVLQRGLPYVSDPVLATRVVRAPNWLELYRALYGEWDLPASEAAARGALCTRFGMDRCTGPGPWVLTRFVNSAFVELEDHVFPEPGGPLLAFHTVVARTTEYTTANELHCVTEQTLDVRLEGRVIHESRRTREPAEGTQAGDLPKDCRRKQDQLDDDLFDAQTGAALLHVARPDGTGAARVRLLADRVAEIAAGSCRVTVPLDLPR